MSIFCTALILALAACAAPTPVPPARFAVQLETGDVLVDLGRRTAAEAAYREAARLWPVDPAPHLRLAYLYLDWNRPLEGLASVDAAAELSAPEVELEPLRAAFYSARAEWERVLAHAAAALAFDPDDLPMRRRLARAHAALGDVDQAAADYADILARAPDDGPAHEQLGALLALSDTAAARPHLQAAGAPFALDLLAVLEVESDGEGRAVGLARLGQVCVRHEAWALAVLALERAVAADPAYAEARALLGHALEQLGRTEAGLEHLQAAVDLAPESILARSLLGLHYLQAGDPAARPHLEAAYDLDPHNPASCIYLAQFQANLGYYREALAWLDEALQVAPDDPVILEAVTRFAVDRGLAGDESLATAYRLVGLVPESATAQELLARALLLAGHHPQAEARLRHALELDPVRASAYYELGRALAAQGHLQRARAALVRAADLNVDPLLRARIERAMDDLE